MKTEVQVKLECLRFAISLATAKMISKNDIMPLAKEFFKWVYGTGGSARNLGIGGTEALQVEFDKREPLPGL